MARLEIDKMVGSMLDDIQENRDIELKSIHSLVPFSNHPFKRYSEAKMSEMIDSIHENGIITPLIVRSIENETYEIIAGHNRWEAAKKAGLNEVPIIVKNVDDETAAIMMVDTNFNQRDEILPSEKAFAYKIKLNAMNSQGKRNDLTLCHCDTKSSAEKIAETNNESVRQIFRYIRLTELIPSVLDRVDRGELGFIPAVDISYLSLKQQEWIDTIIKQNKVKPTKAQAAELKKRNQEKKLSKEEIQAFFSVKKDEKYRAWNPNKTFKALLPKEIQREITPAIADEILAEAMADWIKNHSNKYLK